MASGGGHTCALLKDGYVKCWGRNTFGALGLGDVEHRGDDPLEMGDALPQAEVPVVKASSGILALSYDDLSIGDAKPCIRCSACVTACPAGLLPLEMASRIRAMRLKRPA